MSLGRLWAGWRSEYIESAGAGDVHGEGCVFCRILASGEPDESTHIVWRGERSIAILNAFPYTSGHLMVMPNRHIGEIEDLDDAEMGELWPTVRDAVIALKAAYRPEGINVGANIGRAGGAGVPGHLHVHVVPRWSGDTNFMTSVAESRVLPEALPTSATKLRSTWPH
ncbi:MAG TPA: HIT domain-containing protein [Acidimicrobiales bacterium]|nr:HIT domain-containing protein [Acidimicrobiales bacterium]